MNYLKKIVAAATVAVAFVASAAQANVLFTIDVSDPSAVVITGTGEVPIVNDTATVFSGVSLENFFAGAVTNAQLPNNNPSTLLGNGSSTFLADTFVSSALGGNDLNLYNIPGNGDSIEMNVLLPAFTGSLVVDMSAVLALLPSVGQFGQVYMDDAPADAGFGRPYVGAWQVVATPVPLPASGLLLAGAFGALVVRTRRKQA